MAVASIAHYDWPEDWPDLLPSLMKCITDQTNMNAGESFFHLTMKLTDWNKLVFVIRIVMQLIGWRPLLPTA